MCDTQFNMVNIIAKLFQIQLTDEKAIDRAQTWDGWTEGCMYNDRGLIYI